MLRCSLAFIYLQYNFYKFSKKLVHKTSRTTGTYFLSCWDLLSPTVCNCFFFLNSFINKYIVNNPQTQQTYL